MEPLRLEAKRRAQQEATSATSQGLPAQQIYINTFPVLLKKALGLSRKKIDGSGILSLTNLDECVFF